MGWDPFNLNFFSFSFIFNIDFVLFSASNAICVGS